MTFGAIIILITQVVTLLTAGLAFWRPERTSRQFIRSTSQSTRAWTNF